MEDKLKAVIVDDEEKSVALMERLLEDSALFSQVRSACSSEAALGILEQFNPDLFFIDIRMPGKDGFSLVRDLHDRRTNAGIIFVTAHDQYALEAFRHHAIGYLLKPVNRQELQDCIRYFRIVRRGPDYLEKIRAFLDDYESRGRLRFNTRSGYVLVDPSQILYCEADGNYTNIELGDKQHFCTVQLGHLSESLPANGFARLGRSLIVNLRLLREVDRKSGMISFEKDGRNYSLKVQRSQLRELDRKRGS